MHQFLSVFLRSSSGTGSQWVESACISACGMETGTVLVEAKFCVGMQLTSGFLQLPGKG